PGYSDLCISIQTNNTASRLCNNFLIGVAFQIHFVLVSLVFLNLHNLMFQIKMVSRGNQSALALEPL
ncbi:MAG TPA: hypothetical protein PL069_08320, partial [Saprospiraceae bacterium]|nr:hypothetical protein [Saprospiraceae bacterium]